jgi:hypothetical protein
MDPSAGWVLVAVSDRVRFAAPDVARYSAEGQLQLLAVGEPGQQHPLDRVVAPTRFCCRCSDLITTYDKEQYRSGGAGKLDHTDQARIFAPISN